MEQARLSKEHCSIELKEHCSVESKRCSSEPSGPLLGQFYSDNDPTLPPPADNDRYTKSRTSPVFTYLQTFLFRAISILLATILWIIDTILPSFIPRWASAKQPHSSRRHSATAYLDGLRGVATLIVFLCHFTINWFPSLDRPLGATPADYHFMQLPLVRVFLSGRAAVTCFFVVSGYALSYSALMKIQKGQPTEALSALSSSAFRRCARLYLPCIVNTFICMLLSYNGFFTHDPPHANTIPPQLPTFEAQFWDWWNHMKNLMYPFIAVEGDLYSPPYNGHLWTIPIEIRGSWVTYGTVLASANLAPAWTLVFLILWESYLWYMGSWDLFLFVGGILVANMDVPRHIAAAKSKTKEADGADNLPISNASPSPEIEMSIRGPASIEEERPWPKDTELGLKPTPNRTQKSLNTIKAILAIIVRIWPYILFLEAMYLLSFPFVPWGVNFLISWTPNHWDRMPAAVGQKAQAWRCVGAIILAYSFSLSARPILLPPPSSRSPANDFPPSTTTDTPFPSPKTSLFSRIQTLNLQYLLTNTFSQYLGRISFGMYLMHGPVLFTMGTRYFMVPAWAEWDAGMPQPDEGRYFRWYIWAAVWNTVGVFWAGDVFARAVDERAVRWVGRGAKWISASGGKVGKV